MNEKTKFEGGKWYKLKASHISENSWYLKLEKELTEEFRGEYINTPKYFKNGKFNKTLNYELILLQDLSEIQQYLPKGHPDKFLTKDDLVEGEIYIAKFKKNPEWNSIFKSLGHIKISHRLFLNGSKFDKDGGSWVRSDNILYFNAIQEEKQWLEACIKADRFIPKEEALKQSEEFVLPERWHVIVTKENKDILIKWRFENEKDCNLYEGQIVGIARLNNIKGHNPANIIKGTDYNFGIEITFEQFKKYVLKEDNDVKNNNTIDYKQVKPGDYIVITNKRSKNYNGEVNWCYKIIENGKWISGKEKTYYYAPYNRIPLESGDFKFRYATQSEIDRWNREGKEYDITTEDNTINKTLKTNVWYKSNKCYCYRTGNTNNVGFEGNKWATNILCSEFNLWEEAPIKEVEELLINEAKRKYPIGTRIKLISKIDETEIKGDIKYSPSEEIIWNGTGYGRIYDSGKWAEIVELPKTRKEAIPKYVELLLGWSVNGEFVGEIFDTSKDFQEQFKKFQEIGKEWTWKDIFDKELDHYKYFKPSTKEAYEAQFKSNNSDFKVGDWVIVDNKFLDEYEQQEFYNIPVKIINSTSYTPNKHVNVDIPHNTEGGLNVPINKLRKATQDEIDSIINKNNKYVACVDPYIDKLHPLTPKDCTKQPIQLKKVKAIINKVNKY